MLMCVSHLGTFNNNEEVEIAVHKWLLIQEPDNTATVFLHSCQDGTIS